MEHRRFAFTLATLFRATTLLAFAFAWLAATRCTPPGAMFLVLCGLGVTLGMVVGIRRDGNSSVRIGSAIGFAILAAAIAMYSACVADYLQDPGTDVLGEGMILTLLFPLFGVIAVLLFRGWMYALYDGQIAKGP